MRKALLRDLAEFRQWQQTAVRGVDVAGTMAVQCMPPPGQYPAILIWHFTEQEMAVSRDDYSKVDQLHYRYIYIGDFPVKSIKQGIYVYQIFQTGDGE